MDRIKDRLTEFFDLKHYLVFVGVALFIKIIIFFFASQSNLPKDSKAIYQINGDAITYIEYCENLYQKGAHFTGDEMHKDFTYRMPTFDPIYYPLRCLFSQKTTITILVILQILLSAISTYLLALLAYKLFGKRRFFYLTFMAYALSTYVASFNNFLLTESLSISLLIISLYLLITAEERKDNRLFFFSGLLMAWVVFFRPFLVILWALTIIYIYFLHRKSGAGKKAALIFAITFIVADTAWIARNLAVTERFVPLQDSLEWYKGEYKSLEWQVKFIRAFGFHWMWWSPASEHTWFISDESAKKLGTARPENSIFPSRTFNGGLNIDSLVLARKDVLCAVDSLLPVSTRKTCDIEGSYMLKRFITNLRSSRPIDYYFINRMRIVYSFLNQPLGAPLRSVKYPFNVLAVFADSFINYLVIIGGFLGLLVLAVFSIKNYRLQYYVVFIPAFIIFLFCIVLASDEARFFVTAYPFFLVAMVYFLAEVYNKGFRNYFPGYTVLFALVLWLSYNSMHSAIRW